MKLHTAGRTWIISDVSGGVRDHRAAVPAEWSRGISRRSRARDRASITWGKYLFSNATTGEVVGGGYMPLDAVERWDRCGRQATGGIAMTAARAHVVRIRVDDPNG